MVGRRRTLGLLVFELSKKKKKKKRRKYVACLACTRRPCSRVHGKLRLHATRIRTRNRRMSTSFGSRSACRLLEPAAQRYVSPTRASRPTSFPSRTPTTSSSSWWTSANESIAISNSVSWLMVVCVVENTSNPFNACTSGRGALLASPLLSSPCQFCWFRLLKDSTFEGKIRPARNSDSWKESWKEFSARAEARIGIKNEDDLWFSRAMRRHIERIFKNFNTFAFHGLSARVLTLELFR